jgi:hypothetical protein
MGWQRLEVQLVPKQEWLHLPQFVLLVAVSTHAPPHTLPTQAHIEFVHG